MLSAFRRHLSAASRKKMCGLKLSAILTRVTPLANDGCLCGPVHPVPPTLALPGGAQLESFHRQALVPGVHLTHGG